MVFSDPIFLFLFLPAFVLIANALPRLAFIPLVCAASAMFYFMGSGRFVLLFAVSALANWGVSLWIDPKHRPWLLPCAIAANLIVIGYFKYAFFIASNLDFLFPVGTETAFRNIYLPIGISFFTFQAISYLVDVSRGDVEPAKNPLVFLAYLSFFPQLIAGPIVRYSVVRDQFLKPSWSSEDLHYGLIRFSHGLAKKLIVADTVGGIADAAFALPPSEVGMFGAWLGALAYTIQIYFDFSGYSDMAIGIGRMFGIRFDENFRRPYTATSITDFWRRWHISLSSFFRDYVYIPLGGNRGSATSIYRNLLVVFLLTGIWHGAAWQYIAWGLYHGAFLIAERVVLGGKHANTRTVLSAGYVTIVLVFGWVLFRAENVSYALGMWRTMLDPSSFALTLPDTLIQALDPISCGVLLVSLLVFMVSGATSFGHKLMTPANARTDVLQTGYAAAMLVLAGTLSFSRPFSPFLYFQF